MNLSQSTGMQPSSCTLGEGRRPRHTSGGPSRCRLPIASDPSCRVLQTFNALSDARRHLGARHADHHRQHCEGGHGNGLLCRKCSALHPNEPNTHDLPPLVLAKLPLLPGCQQRGATHSAAHGARIS